MQPSTQQTQPETKRYQCRHVRTSGRRCRSSSLTGHNFCYLHKTTHVSAPASERRAIALGYPIQPVYQIKSIEDRPAIQVALLEIMNQICADTIDNKKAGMLLYALQIASSNLPREPRATKSSAEEDTESEPEPLLDDLVDDPEFGPLAHIAEYIEPARHAKHDPEQPSSFVESFLRELKLESDQYKLEQEQEATQSSGA